MSNDPLNRYRLPGGGRTVVVRVATPELRPLLDSFYVPYRNGEATGPERRIELCMEAGQYRLRGPSGTWYADDPGHAAAFYEAELTDALLADAPHLLKLHGSAVYSADACLLLLGPSGAGKSTLSLGLCLAGMTVLADDALLVDRRDGRVQPFERSLRIHAAGLEKLGIDPARVPGARGVEPFWWVEPSVLRSEAPRARRPTAAFFLEPAGRTGLTSLSPRETLRRLLVARMDAGKPAADFEALHHLAAQAPAYRLGVSDFPAAVGLLLETAGAID